MKEHWTLAGPTAFGGPHAMSQPPVTVERNEWFIQNKNLQAINICEAVGVANRQAIPSIPAEGGTGSEGGPRITIITC